MVAGIRQGAIVGTAIVSERVRPDTLNEIHPSNWCTFNIALSSAEKHQFYLYRVNFEQPDTFRSRYNMWARLQSAT